MSDVQSDSIFVQLDPFFATRLRVVCESGNKRVCVEGISDIEVGHIDWVCVDEKSMKLIACVNRRLVGAIGLWLKLSLEF